MSLSSIICWRREKVGESLKSHHNKPLNKRRLNRWPDVAIKHVLHVEIQCQLMIFSIVTCLILRMSFLIIGKCWQKVKTPQFLSVAMTLAYCWPDAKSKKIYTVAFVVEIYAIFTRIFLKCAQNTRHIQNHVVFLKKLSWSEKGRNEVKIPTKISRRSNLGTTLAWLP